MSKDEERTFHDQFVTQPKIRRFETNFYSQTAQALEDEITDTFLGSVNGKRILLYGAGGHFSLINKYAQLGAQVTAIDISPESVAKLQRAIDDASLHAKCTAVVMDCENLTFPDQSFDIVYARSILHHLDLRLSLKEIRRVLCPEGKLAAIEPLGKNPIINLYRWLTPASRTTGEHPFTEADFRLFSERFSELAITHLYVLTFVAYIYRILTSDESGFTRLFRFFYRIDRWLIAHVPHYSSLCWDAIVCCTRVDRTQRI